MSTLCILTPGREESSGVESTTCTLLEMPKLHYWKNECSSVRQRVDTHGDMYTIQLFLLNLHRTHLIFILLILYNLYIVNMLILNEYLKCQILDIKGEESPQFFPLKTHLMWHNDDTWSTFLCSFSISLIHFYKINFMKYGDTMEYKI